MSVFKAVDILIPQVEEIEKWSVIACDQFTSQPEYWKQVRQYVGDNVSTLNLVFPEAELENKSDIRIKEIKDTMRKYLFQNILLQYSNSYVYVERTLMNGKIRKGVVGMVDLEAYDYEKNASAFVRATEQTVIERIPSRMSVRRNADLDLSHVILFCDDKEDKLIGTLAEHKEEMSKLYDFELMQNGGRITGWLVCGTNAKLFEKYLSEYEKDTELLYRDKKQKAMLYAVGDGNHSLATAKACYEELKQMYPNGNISNHPARYALVELENINDEVQQFKPIHRIIKKVDVQKLLIQMEKKICSKQGNPLEYYTGNERGVLYIEREGLLVNTLQQFLDDYLQENEGEIDYIHGENVLKELAKEKNSIGFLLPTIEKSQLFARVVEGGVLPRKTFSIGHAHEKRYYLETRKIEEHTLLSD